MRHWPGSMSRLLFEIRARHRYLRTPSAGLGAALQTAAAGLHITCVSSYCTCKALQRHNVAQKGSTRTCRAGGKPQLHPGSQVGDWSSKHRIPLCCLYFGPDFFFLLCMLLFLSFCCLRVFLTLLLLLFPLCFLLTKSNGTVRTTDMPDMPIRSRTAKA